MAVDIALGIVLAVVILTVVPLLIVLAFAVFAATWRWLLIILAGIALVIAEEAGVHGGILVGAVIAAAIAGKFAMDWREKRDADPERTRRRSLGYDE